MLEGRNFFRNRQVLRGKFCVGKFCVRQVLRNVNFYTILAILAAPWYSSSPSDCIIGVGVLRHLAIYIWSVIL
jgi:hypothetical protein